MSFARPQPNEGWEALAKRIHQEVQTALADGYDRTQCQQMAKVFRDVIKLEHGKLPEHSISMLKSGAKSNLYFPYTGQTHIKPRYGSVEVTDYRAGGINAVGTLDLLQEIFDNRLHFFASYDSNCFSESLIDSLMQEYIAQLNELISNNSAKQTSQSNMIPQTSAVIETTLLQIAEEICHYPIAAHEMDKDLEADLGLDSLELVRIITRLEQRFGKMDRQALLSCRSLREMGTVLEAKLSVPAPQQQPQRPHLHIVEKKLPEMPYLQIIEQARRTPNAIAILDGDTQLTYQELHLLSNQVANYLRSQGVGANSLVGIMMRRGPLMLVGMLGILKAGGAYVPLDPSYPRERIRYIMEHAEIGILLSEHSLTSKLADCLTEQLPLHTLMFLDEGGIWEEGKAWKQMCKNTWSSWSHSEPNCVNNPDDLMTVLYTSGSTGKPKGVMLNHQGYMNRLQWMQKAFQLRPGDRVAQKTSCCFDISVWELFWPLMEGATVCPVETEIVKNPWSFAQWLQDTRINIAHFVPSLFGEFLTALDTESLTFPDLRWLIFSGEALPVPFIQRWIDKYGMSVGLANLYGPTEASIDVTAHIIQKRPGENDKSIPIGKAIDNVYILILDDKMQLLPPGQMGELWIGGVQLAKGYIKDSKRTADSFRANPFPHIPGEHIYRTGDLAMEMADGSIDYHGRIDHQVKIRGFRIELGEIENVLMSHPAVNEAGVLAVDYGTGDKRLVAVLAGSQVDNRQIKEHLQQRLPHYMIPHRLQWLPSLPKNHNGKLDRKALLTIITEGASKPEQKASGVAGEFLPLGPAQRWLMKYFAPTYEWTGYTRFRYLQALDQNAFNQALNLIVERHSILRTLFVQRNGQWMQQVVNPDKPMSAEFYDGSHLDAEQRDEEIAHLTRQVAEQLRIDQLPLIKVVVVKIHETCFDITIVGHHLIGDLLSNNIVFKDFWSIYSLILGNQIDKLKAQSPQSSYADFVNLLVEEEKRGTLVSHVDYWKSHFPSQEYALKVPFDHQKGANIEASAASERFTLSKNDSDTLLRKAKQHYGSNLYSILLAPLYRLMGEWSELSWVALSHRSHGRDLGDNRRFLDTVGNFAVNYPIGVNVGQEERWEQIVKRIAEAFDSVPMKGVTFDWVSEQLPDYLHPDTNLTPVRANYLGNRDLPSMELFEFTAEDWDRRLSPPEQKRTALLEFFFSVVDGTLQLEIEYSSHFHLPTTIRKLGDRYLELMQAMLGAMSNTSTPQWIKLNSRPSQAATPLPMTENYPHALRNLPLFGKVAIVTGSEQGIGRAIALKLAEQGASVAVLGRTVSELEETAALIRSQGAEAIVLPGDVTDQTQVEAMVEKVVKQFGGIDILVNNAGITDFASLAESAPTQWRRIMEMNLFGTYNFCRSVVPFLFQRGQGKIVNLCSDSSFIDYPLFSAYGASKHAIVGLTKSLAEELQTQNIQVNAVCPAFVDTDVTPKALRKDANPAQQVADVVSFLASPQSDSITGECLKVFSKQEVFWRGLQNIATFAPLGNSK
ncbi:MAG: amino acid adenylation domain-containing protein [Scytonema sp. PMC 1069.18]|nr:amino acid adenylation domain-containing protein [Scytonema sp. PMC 1069.18]MEC4885420.1 amino acid adenylation domain-containing protein [Scytonema sp. PMC 1070.18]